MAWMGLSAVDATSPNEMILSPVTNPAVLAGDPALTSSTAAHESHDDKGFCDLGQYLGFERSGDELKDITQRERLAQGTPFLCGRGCTIDCWLNARARLRVFLRRALVGCRRAILPNCCVQLL